MKSHKNTIVFIHGFRKDAESWNVTSTGKSIQIEQTIAKAHNTNNTINIQLTEEDYCKPVSWVIWKVSSVVDLESNITLVAHSIGALYALKLAELYPSTFKKLLLIDPTIKTPEYRDYLVRSIDDPTKRAQLENYDDLTCYKTLPAKIIIRLHFNYCAKSAHHIPYFNKMTNKNAKSRLILHISDHMIHWNAPHVIIDSINEMIRL